MSKPNVVVIQQIVPHYRMPLFRKLCESERITCAVAYGKERAGSSLRSEAPFPGVLVHTLENVFFGPGKALVFQKGLLSLLRKGRVDVVIAEFDVHIISSIVACLVAHVYGVRFIWWGHGIGTEIRWLSKKIRLFLSHFADAMIFYGQTKMELFRSWGVAPDKLFVAWNSIDTDEVFALADEWSQRPRTRILYVGRLVPEKKVHILIEAFALARNHLVPDVVLTIIGDGPERRGLETMTRDLQLFGYVEFAGPLNNQKDLAPLFNTSFVSVSPGAMGLSAIHSLAYGVPMLVADKEPHGPEVAAIEDGTNGLFFESDNAARLSEVLITLHHDRESLAGMSSAGRRTVKERFSLGAMVNSFENAVNFALSNDRS